MPLHIANPAIVDKVERLARATGLSTTAAVERAVDQLLVRLELPEDSAGRLTELLALFDRIPDRADAHDPLPWDDAGLPR